MSNRKPANAAVSVECVIPILNVKNIPASVRYYVDVLGFKVDWGEGDTSDMASV